MLPLFTIGLFAVAGGPQARTPRQKAQLPPAASVRFLNRSPLGYSQVVEVRGGRTLYVAGQIAVDAESKLVGAGDFDAQAKQVFANLDARLRESGATFHDVVKLNYYITDAANLQALRAARDAYVNQEHPPASKLAVVKQLFRPDFLCEVEAIAVVAE